MKHRMKKIISFIFICFFLFSQSAAATETKSIEEFSQIDSLWEAIPEEVEKEEIFNLFEKRSEKSFFQSVVGEIGNAFSIGLSRGFRLFASLSGLLLISALFRNVKKSFKIKGMENSFDFIFFLIMSLTAYSGLKAGIENVALALRSIHSFFIASLPVTTVLLTMTGGGGAARTLGVNINLVLGTVNAIVSTYLAPLLNTLFCFSMVDGATDLGLGGLITFIKKTAKVLCVLFFTLVSATLSLQSVLATSADSLAMRSVRFAAGNFIPVVGSLVGENAKTLSASFQAIKSECGVLCLLILFYIILRPILTLAVQKIFLSFAGTVGEILGETKCKSLLSSLSSLFDLLMALMISEGCYLVFYITIFINHRGSF